MIRGFSDAQIDQLVQATRERRPYTFGRFPLEQNRLMIIELIQTSLLVRICCRLLLWLDRNRVGRKVLP